MEQLQKELNNYKDLINDDKERVVPVIDYVCRFCGKTYGELDKANDHIAECLRNVYDNHTCVTCKHAEYNLMPPYPRYMNKYDKLVQESITSNYGYFTCGKKNPLYNGKLSEEKILRKDKECYEQLELDTIFGVKQTEEWLKYKSLLDRASLEQDEINEDITRFYAEMNRLTQLGLSPEEINSKLDKWLDENMGDDNE